jgi:type II secretion system protein N
MADLAATRQFVRANLLTGLLYAGFFVAAFILCAYLTFPYDRLRDFLVAKIEDAGKGRADTMHLRVGELEPSFMTGVVLRDVELSRQTEADGAPSVLHFDEVRARVSAWSLITGSPKVSLNALVGEGELSATYEQETEGQHVEAELDALDVGKLGLGTFLGVPLKGRASGTVDMALTEDPMKSTGTLDLTIAGLRIGDGKAKLSLPGMGSGMTLEEIDAGALALAIKTQNGAAELTRFQTDGKDLKINGEGSVRLANPLRRSRPDIVLGLKLSDAYKNKSDRNKALFEILSMQPDWQRATGSDGALSLHVGGTLQTPRATPGGGRPRKR